MMRFLKCAAIALGVIAFTAATAFTIHINMVKFPAGISAETHNAQPIIGEQVKETP